MINTLFNLFLITWFITENSYIQMYVDKLGDILLKTEELDNFLQTPLRIILISLYDILSCHKCLSFWIVLIITLNPIWAIGTSIVAFTLQKLINKI